MRAVKAISFSQSGYLCALASCLVLASCSFTADLVPKDGPTAEVIRNGAEIRVASGERLSYAFVKVGPGVVNAVNRSTDAIAPHFKNLAPVRNYKVEAPIGVGDVISVTVFEALAGGLFIPAEAGVRSGNLVQMPNQEVDVSGQVNVPYIGNLRVAGRSPREVGAEISRRLASRAIEPQTIVSIVERRSNDVSVLGDVNAPTRFFMDPAGIRLLAAIARAGGPKSPAHETIVTIQRRGATAQAVLSAIIKEPSQNVFLAGGDSVFLAREPKVFMAFGATIDRPGASLTGIVGGSSVSRRFSFDADNFSLAEGIAKAGGLDSIRADPKGVFLLRFENRKTLAALGVDAAAYGADLVPTIYAVDLSVSDGFFLMESFHMRHQDVIVVSDSPTADLQKLLGVFNNLSQIAQGASFLANATK